jgi:hypothetical protein
VEKPNFMKKNFLPFFLSNEKNVLPCYLTLGKVVDALLPVMPSLPVSPGVSGLEPYLPVSR